MASGITLMSATPEFLDVLGIMKRIALPDKYAEMIRPKHNAG